MSDQQEKITILYCRLSSEDASEGESNSIQNQRDILTRYAETHGHANIRVLTDDGYTGTNFDRPGVQEGLALVEQGLVGTWIVKDMSRFGRDYLQVGRYTELVFPEHDVRFIAVSDGVDSAKGDDDFTPFRNLFNDFYAKDTSKKVRAVIRARGTSGKHIGAPPYGYLRDPADKEHWVPDPETAPVVRHIFDLTVDGRGPDQIARILESEQVLTTRSLYAQRKGKPLPEKPYRWNVNSVTRILERMEYAGCTCNFKTYSRSYKLKKRLPNRPEDMFIVWDTQEAVVSKAQWERVQELRQNKRRPVKAGRQGLFSGLLFCADCGGKLHFSTCKNFDGRQDHYVCSGYKSGRGDCSAHYIREDVLREIVLERIRAVNTYIRKDAEGFQEEWLRCRRADWQASILEEKKQLERSRKRVGDLDLLISRCYEDMVLGTLSRDRYAVMTQGYEQEQAKLKEEIAVLEEWIGNEEETGGNMDGFLELVRRYIDMPELTPTIVNEYIRKIIVYAPEKSCGHRQQKLKICWNFLDEIDLPAVGGTVVYERCRKTQETA